MNLIKIVQKYEIIFFISFFCVILISSINLKTKYINEIYPEYDDIGVISGSSQTLEILNSLNSYTSSNDTINTTQNTRLDQLSTETGSITTEQSVQDQRLSAIEADSGSYLKTVDISSDTNLAVSDSANIDMILTDDTLSANLKGGVVSGS